MFQGIMQFQLASTKISRVGWVHIGRMCRESTRWSRSRCSLSRRNHR